MIIVVSKADKNFQKRVKKVISICKGRQNIMEKTLLDVVPKTTTALYSVF
jgi:hypothetical protein